MVSLNSKFSVCFLFLCALSLSLSLSLSFSLSLSLSFDCLIGIVVKVFTSGTEDPGLYFRLRHGHFSGSRHTSDLKIGTPVATLPGA